ncbi:hypothetical protein ACVOMV_29740 [Mesorhizobium atlanticum]
MLVHQRQEAQRRDDNEEDDDQCRDRPAQKRLGGQEPLIGGFGDQARIAGKSVAPCLATRKSLPSGRAPRVRLGHKWHSPICRILDDPDTPHARIVIKESNVIRVVQRHGRKRLKVD